MERYWEDSETGEIHFRDKWQFELKSEFTPSPELKNPIYIQEFYIFIPNALQINHETYSKAEFYKDQTNLIRYKTPVFSFEELMDYNNQKSPLFRLKYYETEKCSQETLAKVEDEAKLYGNIFRSTLRRSVEDLEKQMPYLDDPHILQIFKRKIHELLLQIQQSLDIFHILHSRFAADWRNGKVDQTFTYVDEFIHMALNLYLTEFLYRLRKVANPQLEEVDERICNTLNRERRMEILPKENDSKLNEAILYRHGLLNKFVIDALFLNISRASIDQKYRTVIGAIPAAVAMLIFFTLFTWQGSIFVINSMPFIVFTVLIYVLKDRIKEELKTLSYQQAFRWFADYSTEIRSSTDDVVIGELRESFAFINDNDIPKEIKNVRNTEFHTLLDKITRQEQAMYYKKTIAINEKTIENERKLSGLNIIFRYDIHRFLNKASNPYEPYITLDPLTKELNQSLLPKVYHVNIILKNTYVGKESSTQVEIKKFRLVVDKEGIKRVENVNGNRD